MPECTCGTIVQEGYRCPYCSRSEFGTKTQERVIHPKYNARNITHYFHSNGDIGGDHPDSVYQGRPRAPWESVSVGKRRKRQRQRRSFR
jgi:hypothetical protein